MHSTKHSIAEAVTARTWQRILDPASPIFARLAVVDDAVIGFSISVLHDSTWTIAPVCYLEDLFVAPEFRGRGFGRMLIADLVDRAKSNGWSRLYWHTRASNPARRLYDEFAKADDFVRYRASGAALVPLATITSVFAARFTASMISG